MIFRFSYSSTLVACLSIALFGTYIISSSHSAQKSTAEELQHNLLSTIDGKITNIIDVPS